MQIKSRMVSDNSTRDEDEEVIFVKRNSTAFNMAISTFPPKTQADILIFLKRIDKVIKRFPDFKLLHLY